MRTEAQLFELYQELQHALTEARVLESSVIPEMQAALEDTRYAFERGRYSFLEWVDAQRELIVLRHLCHMSYEEIARTLNLASEDTARRGCNRALQRLKQAPGA